MSVTVTDDDAVGYTIVQSGGSTDVSESGTADTFTIVLDSQPNTRVRLNFTSLDTDEFSVRPVGHTWMTLTGIQQKPSLSLVKLMIRMMEIKQAHFELVLAAIPMM